MNVYVIWRRSIIIISSDDYGEKKNKERLCIVKNEGKANQKLEKLWIQGKNTEMGISWMN